MQKEKFEIIFFQLGKSLFGAGKMLNPIFWFLKSDFRCKQGPSYNGSLGLIFDPFKHLEYTLNFLFKSTFYAGHQI